MLTEKITSTPNTKLSRASRTLSLPLNFIKNKIYGASTAQSPTAASPQPALQISIKTTDTKNEPPLREASKEQVYELCTINDSGVFLPPSPDAINSKRDHWHVRQSSDEPFPSTDRLIMRRSLSDSHPVLNLHTPSFSGSRPPSPSMHAQVNEAHLTKRMTWDDVMSQQEGSSARLPIKTRPSSPEPDDDETAPPSLSDSVSSSTSNLLSSFGGSVFSSTMSDPLSSLGSSVSSSTTSDPLMEDNVMRTSFPETAKAGPRFKWENIPVQA